MESSSGWDTWKDTPWTPPVFMATERRPAQTFRDLQVWQKAHQFVRRVYEFTAGFPRQETFGLSLQMRRAAVSVAAWLLAPEFWLPYPAQAGYQGRSP